MSTSESDPNTELLKSIATSLKAIHSSLESLTGAVEGVAESIEKAHEPEGDLGVHLVSALKDLTSSLHKRAQQERSAQPQQQNQRYPQERQERRPQLPDRHSNQRQNKTDSNGPTNISPRDGEEETASMPQAPVTTSEGNSEPTELKSPDSKPAKGRGGRRRPRGGGNKATPASE